MRNLEHAAELSRDNLIGWMQRESQRRITEENPYRDEALAPVARFPAESGWFRRHDGTDPRTRRPGEPCRALQGLVHGCCNGWRQKPTALEAEEAIKNRTPGTRANAIAWTAVTESTIALIIETEKDHGYSLQDLAWWIHELEIPAKRLIHWLNAMSES